jgi:ferredoxin
MDKRRIVLRFPKEIIEKPIISDLAKGFDLTFSILKATINAEEGVMLLELEGTRSNILKGIGYLKENTVVIEELNKDVAMNEDKCSSCGACVTICPTKALYRDEDTYKTIFDSTKCIACELCVKGCPYRAMEVHF